MISDYFMIAPRPTPIGRKDFHFKMSDTMRYSGRTVFFSPFIIIIIHIYSPPTAPNRKVPTTQHIS